MSVSTAFPFEELDEFAAKLEAAGGDRTSVAVMVAELASIVASVKDKHLAAVLDSFFGKDGILDSFSAAPASMQMHSNYVGGLLEHTVAVMKLAHRLADQYPQVDRDLLVAGAFLHDLGKGYPGDLAMQVIREAVHRRRRRHRGPPLLHEAPDAHEEPERPFEPRVGPLHFLLGRRSLGPGRRPGSRDARRLRPQRPAAGGRR